MENCNKGGGRCGVACTAEVTTFLQPGDWFFGDRNACARTTLGSCVAFTFWHSQLRIGGICHYMLAHRAGLPPTSGLDGRYADEALELLRQSARDHGTRLSEYEVKLFGGAEMFQLPNRAVSSVAKANVTTAKELAQKHGLRVKCESLGGSSYRQLIFSIASGDVWVKCGPATPRTRDEPIIVGGGC